MHTHTHTQHTHTHRQAHPTTNRAQGSAEDGAKNGESSHEPRSIDLAIRPSMGGRGHRASPLGVHAPYHRPLCHPLLAMQAPLKLIKLADSVHTIHTHTRYTTNRIVVQVSMCLVQLCLMHYETLTYAQGRDALWDHTHKVFIGKQNCIQCDELKNLLDEKGIRLLFYFSFYFLK